jgi:hypothetical protein
MPCFLSCAAFAGEIMSVLCLQFITVCGACVCFQCAGCMELPPSSKDQLHCQLLCGTPAEDAAAGLPSHTLGLGHCILGPETG